MWFFIMINIHYFSHRRIQEASNGNDSYNSSIEDVSEREKGNFDLIEIFESNNFTYESMCDSKV